MKRSELARRKAIAQALSGSAALGAFTVAVGLVGLDGAVALCESREYPKDILDQWGELGYRPEQMPSAEEIRLVVLGVEIQRAQFARDNAHKEPLTLASFSCGAAEAQRALKVCERFGATAIHGHATNYARPLKAL